MVVHKKFYKNFFIVDNCVPTILFYLGTAYTVSNKATDTVSVSAINNGHTFLLYRH